MGTLAEDWAKSCCRVGTNSSWVTGSMMGGGGGRNVEALEDDLCAFSNCHSRALCLLDTSLSEAVDLLDLPTDGDFEEEDAWDEHFLACLQDPAGKVCGSGELWLSSKSEESSHSAILDNGIRMCRNFIFNEWKTKRKT